MVFLRSQRVKIIGLTDLACPNTLKNYKNWTCESWSPQWNTKIANVNLAGVPSAFNSELALEPSFLPMGLYKCTYIVCMDFDIYAPFLEDMYSVVIDSYIYYNMLL